MIGRSKCSYGFSSHVQGHNMPHQETKPKSFLIKTAALSLGNLNEPEVFESKMLTP